MFETITTIGLGTTLAVVAHQMNQDAKQVFIILVIFLCLLV